MYKRKKIGNRKIIVSFRFMNCIVNKICNRKKIHTIIKEKKYSEIVRVIVIRSQHYILKTRSVHGNMTGVCVQVVTLP